MKHLSLAVAMLLLAPHGSAMAQQPTVQQQFDAASNALAARNWTEALRLYEALEARLNNARSLAVVRARKASALAELGRLGDASAAIRLALPALPAGDASLNQDRFLALLTLGRIAEILFDYDTALRQYRLASSVTLPDLERLGAYRGLIQTQLFTDAEGAIRDADDALRMLATAAPGDRALEGQLRTLKGRALLNLGRLPQAREELSRSLRLLGDLTTRVDRADLLARSDLAIAALLVGNREDARRYLAYTGAGRLQRGSVEALESSNLPSCGAEIAPDDVAIVEAYITAGGHVASATPIYASRQGPSALAFARAVSHWAFNAEQLREVPALFRSVVRFELRCTTLSPAQYIGDTRFELTQLATADASWRATIDARRFRSADELRSELSALERTERPSARALLPLLTLLADSPELSHQEREAVLRRALPLAIEASAPAKFIAGVAMDLQTERAAQRPTRPARFEHGQVLALPELSRLPAAAAYVRLSQARQLFDQGDDSEALALATEIRDGPEAARDPEMRKEALEILVAVHAARGEEAEARAAHAAIGPGAARCGLPPRRRNMYVTNSDFPNEALRWEFEGWAINEVSASPDGRNLGSRTVIAYPPFVFGEATRTITDRMRFVPSYVPGGQPCTVKRTRIRFEVAS